MVQKDTNCLSCEYFFATNFPILTVVWIEPFTSHNSLAQYCLDSIHCVDSDPRTATTTVQDSRVGCGVDSSGCAGDSGCTAAERSCTPRTGSAD